jgi:hypothetical protein
MVLIFLFRMSFLSERGHVAEWLVSDMGGPAKAGNSRFRGVSPDHCAFAVRLAPPPSEAVALS